MRRVQKRKKVIQTTMMMTPSMTRQNISQLSNTMLIMYSFSQDDEDEDDEEEEGEDWEALEQEAIKEDKAKRQAEVEADRNEGGRKKQRR